MKHFRYVVAALVLTLIAVFALTQQHTYAAYNGGIVRINERQPDGTYRLVVGFTGNAGEAEVPGEYRITGSTTAAALKQWGIAQVTSLQSAKTLGTAASLQVGQTFDLTPVTVTPTAFQQWQAKEVRLQRLKTIAETWTNAELNQEITDVTNQLAAAWVTGYAQQLP